MVKQLANGPFTNRPLGFHIYADSECLEFVQKTVIVAVFASLYMSSAALGLTSKICIFLSPHPSDMTFLPLYHCFKTYTLHRLILHVVWERSAKLEGLGNKRSYYI